MRAKTNVITEIAEKRHELEALCHRLGVSRLQLFGSAASGEFRANRSDLDFLVVFQSRAPSLGYVDRYFELLESLEQLFGRPVDLVVDSAIRNPFFRASLDRTKTLLYAA